MQLENKLIQINNNSTGENKRTDSKFIDKQYSQNHILQD